jgi:hypothetical protein
MSEQMTPESTRRHGIRACPVRLADGAAWGFASPMVLLVPRLETRQDDFGRPIENVVVEFGFGYPLATRRLLENLRSVCAQGSVSQQYDAFMALAISLLRRAHDISVETACELLTVPDDQMPRLAEELMAVISGREATGGSQPAGGTGA